MKENKYKEIYERYSKYIISSMGHIIFVSKKWIDADLVWPFSDLDFRIVLEENNVDYFEINETIFNIHKKIETETKENERILEHTPGYIFYEKELYSNRIEDVNNWSFCYGNKDRFNELKRNYNENNKKKDIHYYKNFIIKRYKKFSLDNEFNEFQDKESENFKVYCVIWHYYLPCLYSIYSICDDEIKNRKIKKKLIKNELLMSIYTNIKNDSISKKEYNVEEIVKVVDNEISKELKNNNIDLKIKNTKEDRILEAISMLRTRICRYLLYLDNSLDFDKNYLINREIKELKFIIEEINKKFKMIEVESLFKYINNTDDNPKEILDYTLRYFYDNKNIFNSIMNYIF